MGRSKNMRNQHRVNISQYQKLMKTYKKLKRSLGIFSSDAERNHFELLRLYHKLRYNQIVQFLMWIRLIPRR